MSKLKNQASRASHILRQGGFAALKVALAKRVLARQGDSAMWHAYQQEAAALVRKFDFSADDLATSQCLQAKNRAEMPIRSVTWFIPDFKHAYYGGMYTILRFADILAREKSILNQFALLGTFDPADIRRKIGDAFPSLRDAPVKPIALDKPMDDLSPTDASIATLWSTAYPALKFNNVKRKFYFIQDYEPLFYPAGSTQAQVEATYTFGFDGLCNTPSLCDIYQAQYGGQAISFMPAVDRSIFNCEGRRDHPTGEPWKVFFYGRPEHPRNGFELGSAALIKLKHRLGERAQIFSAGDTWDPQQYGLAGIVENLGLLPYTQTAQLYKSCDVGLVMMFTRHPSYLPFELMASGCCVVSNLNPWTQWFLEDGKNCLLSKASATSLADRLEEALINAPLHRVLTENAERIITDCYSDWHSEIEKLYTWMGAARVDR